MIIPERSRSIDHIVYCVQDLDAAMDWFEDQTGVRPEFGGYHTTQGTKNALVGLGEDRYLEFLAVDSENTEITSPRWMGVDLINKCQITRWAVKSENLKADSDIINEFDNELGKINGGQRKTASGESLRWKMIMPVAEPCVDLIPFMIDWRDTGEHPAQYIKPQVEFVSLQFAHPEPEPIEEILGQLQLDYSIVQGIKPGIFLTIKTPKGEVEL